MAQTINPDCELRELTVICNFRKIDKAYVWPTREALKMSCKDMLKAYNQLIERTQKDMNSGREPKYFS